MKNTIIFFSVLAFILACGIFSEIYIGRKATELTGSIDTVKAEIGKSDVADSYNAFLKKWEKDKHTLEMLTDHGDVKRIDEHLGDLSAIIGDSEKRTDAAGIIGEITSVIDSIPHHMKFRFENIL